jgi:hypothetical protein
LLVLDGGPRNSRFFPGSKVALSTGFLRDGLPFLLIAAIENQIRKLKIAVLVV